MQHFTAHRFQDRHLCSELVSILCTSGDQSGRAVPGNLEEIGEASALVLTEAPMQRGIKIWITCELHHLKGRVKSCTLDRQLGYFVEVALDADSEWSPAWFTPKHLLRVFRSVAA